MTTLTLRPRRGGFLRPFHCGLFIREFLKGNGPHASPIIDSNIGAPQADISYHYKMALIRATALDKATRLEERNAKRGKRPINPDNIDKLAERFQSRMPYKGHGCRYHSFVTSFSTLKKLGWVEPSGYEELSSFQQRFAAGQPRRFYRLTQAGLSAPDSAWANPYRTLYG